MSPKVLKIVYWTTTVIYAGMMSLSAVMYFTNAEAAAGFTHLGYPDYFRVELGIFKILGAFALVIPFIPHFLKEWAYAGFFFTAISAAVSHAAVGDPVSGAITPLVIALILVVSYVTRRKFTAS